MQITRNGLETSAGPSDWFTHHAAVVADVGPGKSAAVVGDGAVGLCGVIAAERLGAEQIVIMGRHEDRIALAREFGATDVVTERGASMPGAQQSFYENVTIGGGPAPVRAYIDELLPDVLGGRIEPGRVFDRTVDLDGVPDGYRAMNDRESIEVLVKP
jgi:threonine dehydrogenase-like Zn-dependent dehydrogenase